MTQKLASELVEHAAQGSSFIIAKAGKPLVKVTAFKAPPGAGTRRLGFMAGQAMLPADFELIGAEEIEDGVGLERDEAKPSLVEIGVKFCRDLRASTSLQQGQPADKPFRDSLYEDD